MQINVVSHPIAVDKVIKVSRPSCQCKGAKIENLQGKVKKVIKNNSGFWYYLDIGVTVRADWVTDVL